MRQIYDDGIIMQKHLKFLYLASSTAAVAWLFTNNISNYLKSGPYSYICLSNWISGNGVNSANQISWLLVCMSSNRDHKYISDGTLFAKLLCDLYDVFWEV
jgi:hypothetical protein